MVRAKRPGQIEKMRRAGALTASVLRAVARKVAPGVTTRELDDLAERLIRKNGAQALFKGYRGYPATLCVSINEQVVHGIPGDRELLDGDIVSVDCGVRLSKWCGDAAFTATVGRVAPEADRLVRVCEEALREAVRAVRPGASLSAVCGAVERHAAEQGYTVVRQFTGHGIGREMHEEPQVPNFVAPGMPDPVLRPGMTLAIEPMLNVGGSEVEVLSDGWTVVTCDRKLSAHFEHTVAVTETGAEVLTR